MPEAPPTPVPAPHPASQPAPKPLFGKAYRGYNPQEVDEHVAALKHELALASRHRDEATASVAELSRSLSYTQKELAETKAGLGRLVDDPSGPAAMSERVKAMMQLADEEIQEIKGKAEQDAANTRDAAEAYADKTRQKAEAVAAQLAQEAKAQREQLDQEAADRRAAAERKSAEKIATLERQSADKIGSAERESAERITAAERKSSEEIAAKRAAAEKAAAELTASTKARTDALLSDAETRLADATLQQNQAVEFRKTVYERLTSSHSALQDAIETLGALPEAPTAKTNGAKAPQNA